MRIVLNIIASGRADFKTEILNMNDGLKSILSILSNAQILAAVIVILLAVLLVFYKHFIVKRIKPELLTQYFISIVAGFVGGCLVLFADNLKETSSPVTYLLFILTSLIMIIIGSIPVIVLSRE